MEGSSKTIQVTLDEMSKRDSNVVACLRSETVFKLIISTCLVTYIYYSGKSREYEMGKQFFYGNLLTEIHCGIFIQNLHTRKSL